MSKLTQKQKAEAYERALEKAKDALKDGGISFNAIAYLQDIFPELKNEMIKKKLLSLIEWSKSFNNPSGITNEEAKEMADWIEKQGEQKPVEWSEEDELRIKELESLVKEVWTIAEQENDKDTINKMSNLSFFLKTLKPHNLRRQQRDILLKAINDAGYTFDFKNKELKKIKQNPIWNEKDEYYRNIILYILNNECVGKTDKENAINWFKSLKPQKAADEIDNVANFSDDGKCHDEPKHKFKIGDWIITPENKVLQITSIEGTSYRFNDETYWETCYCDEKCRLWTIEDAKDGDVLICKGNVKYTNGIKYERICLFKNLENAFFTLTKTSHYVEEYGIDVNIDYPDNTVPATKEQKEILFMAMTDAGYTFDFEKKELKKIEQKSEPKFKVGDWIIFNNNSDAHQVKEIEDGVYTLRNSIGGKMVLSSVLDKLIRHWTIKDAKDGDILVIAENGEPFIFKDCSDTNHPDAPVAYCGIAYGDELLTSPNNKLWTGAKVLPATKEQRDLLFRKIKESGREWDVNKKRLKEVKPKLKIEKGQWYMCIKDLLNDYGDKAFCKGETYLSTKAGSLIPCNSNVPFKITCADEYFRPWSIQNAEERTE